MQKIKDVIKLIRVKHWIKNFLIYATMFLSKQVTLNNFIRLTIGFFFFFTNIISYLYYK